MVSSRAERPPADARERMIVAAERLIAERGAAVPLRDIVVAAAQRNSSAVQYHFGSRDALIEAVVQYRMRPMFERRAALIAEHDAAGRPDSVPALVEMLVRPMLEIPYRDGATHYARFLAQVRNHDVLAHGRLSDADRAADKVIVTRLSKCLRDLPARARKGRLEAMATTMFALLAQRERMAEAEGRRLGDGRDAAEMVAMLSALVSAPLPSRPTARSQ